MSRTYSGISSIELLDFMAFPSLLVEFDDPSDVSSGFHSDSILNIKGFNDSGKSALLVALGVCLLNAYPRKQKSFIRDSRPGFAVRVVFRDSVSIIREKYADGTSLYEMYKGDDLLFTSRAGSYLTPIEDVPGPIKDYLGLFSEGSFLLNMRRRTDPMLLVNTTGSENFSMLNAVLKTSELTSAAGAASLQANEAASDIRDLTYSLQSSQDSLEEIWVAPDDVVNIQRLVDEYEGIHARLSSLSGLSSQVEELSRINVVPPYLLGSLSDSVESSASLLSLSEGLSTLISNLLGYSSLDVIPADISVPETPEPPKSLPTLSELVDSLESYSLIPVPVPDDLIPPIPDEPPLRELSSLQSLLTQGIPSVIPDTLLEPARGAQQHLDLLEQPLAFISSLSENLSQFNAVSNSIIEDQDKIDEIVAALRDCEVEFVTCPSCGQIVPLM